MSKGWGPVPRRGTAVGLRPTSRGNRRFPYIVKYFHLFYIIQ